VYANGRQCRKRKTTAAYWNWSWGIKEALADLEECTAEDADLQEEKEQTCRNTMTQQCRKDMK
jgi:hypothetical protein